MKSSKPNAKSRIYLAKRAKSSSGFAVWAEEIPTCEKWLFYNKIALKTIQAGLKEAKEGKLHHLGSFAKYSK